MWNLPNIITIFRILLLPLFVIFFFIDGVAARWITLAIFCTAAWTDWLDGFLARKMNIESPFGAFLDPVADKLLVTVTLVMLAANYSSPWFVIPAAIMVAREVLISALREWMSGNNQRDVVAVGYIGKVKTTTQMLAIIALLAAHPGTIDVLLVVGYVLIYISAVLTLWSMFSYLKSAWPMLRQDLKQKSS